MVTRRGRSGVDELAPFVLTNVKGLKGGSEEAGHGAYGVIYNVTVNGLPYVAKRLHKALVKQVCKSEDIKKKFRSECITLSRLKHPNIVHFIGVHYGREKNDLVLIMECLQCDLSEFLETHPQFPLPLKLSILLDVAYGLLYLHTHVPPIVHRDLTARNVLLTCDVSAKIADLGVAKLLTPKAMMAVNKHTKAPGQPLYMPPETLTENPECTPKIDIFSFGHLSLFTINQEDPEVFEVIKIPREYQRQGSVQALKRRPALENVGKDHCMHPLITQCLHDNPTHRTTTIELTEKMQELCTKYPRRSVKDVMTLGDKSRNVFQLKNEKAELESQLEATQAQVLVFQSDFADERKDREQAHSKLADLEKQLAQEQGLFAEEKAEYNRQLTIAHQEAESARKELEQATKKLEYHRRNTIISDEYKVLNTAHLKDDVRAKENQEIAAEVKSLQEELTQLTTQYKRLEIENHKLQRQVEILQAFLTEQDKQLQQKSETEASTSDDSSQIKQQLQMQYDHDQMKDTQPGQYTNDGRAARDVTKEPIRAVLRAASNSSQNSSLSPVLHVDTSDSASRHPYLPIRASHPDTQPSPNASRLSNIPGEDCCIDIPSPLANDNTTTGDYSQGLATAYQMQYLQQFSQLRVTTPGVPKPHNVTQESRHKPLYHHQQQSFQHQQEYVQVQGQAKRLDSQHPSHVVNPQEQLLQQMQSQQHQQHYLLQPWPQQVQERRQVQDSQQQIHVQEHVHQNLHVMRVQEQHPQQMFIQVEEHHQLMQTQESPQQIQVEEHQLHVAQQELHYQNIPHRQSYDKALLHPNKVEYHSTVAPSASDYYASGGTPTILNDQIFANPLEISQLQTSVPVHIQPDPQSHSEELIHDKPIRNDMYDQTQQQSPLSSQGRSSMQDDIDDVIQQYIAVPVVNVTDTRRPFDPNLVCPMCDKPFRIGEIQRFRTHVNQCEGSKKGGANN